MRVPLANGGEHRISNIGPSCASCNLSKNAADPHDYVRRIQGVPATIDRVLPVHREAMA